MKFLYTETIELTFIECNMPGIKYSAKSRKQRFTIMVLIISKQNELICLSHFVFNVNNGDYVNKSII